MSNSSNPTLPEQESEADLVVVGEKQESDAELVVVVVVVGDKTGQKTQGGGG